MNSIHQHIFAPEGTLRRHATFLLIIALLTLAVYGRTISFDFLSNWDDPEYITRNQAIRGFSLSHIMEAFTRPWVGNYAPLQIISYMIDYLFWGMNPVGFHLTAIMLHAANGMLLFLLTTRISGMKTAGFIAAIIFVVHPVQVETVAWLSQRKTLLSLFFFLISFLMYLRSRQPEQHSRIAFILAVGSFIAALLSKSTAVVLPLCLVVYEVTVAGNTLGKGLWKRLLPFIIAAGATALLTLYLQTPEMGGGRVPYHGGSPWATFLTMLPVMAHYLRMLVFPFNLSALYIPPIKTVPDWEVFLAALLLVAAAAACATCYLRCRPLFFWCALFFIPLLPVSQIIPLVTLINDRYLYFPLLGAAGLAGQAAMLLNARQPGSRKWLFYIAIACMTAYLSIGAYQRTAVWRSSVTLWSDTVRKNPPSKDISWLLASSYKDAGQLSEAVETYRRLFTLSGEFADSRYEQAALLDAARLFMEIGSYAEAEPLLLRLTARFPQNPAGFASMATCFSVTGRKEAAQNAFLRALEIDPEIPQGLIGLATLFLDADQPDKAAPLLDRATAAGIDGPDLQVALARFTARKEDYNQALWHLERAMQQGLVNPARLKLLPDFTALADNQRFLTLTGAGR